ncbi:hypothetical protein [Natrinema versiforme]|uniref:Uncharacterized protein n=1 Tax=Natrinema versiforme JCM 10478 TaxID=1227496 RepID=L9Y563_9EURY|nr:hypothetical protein [Natrinema versiforme]ELY68867.1 hypothetical protein C489_05858 [Natrinema versiforme JCM 10478]
MCSYCDRDDGHTREHCPERLEDKYRTVDLRDGETTDDDSHADVVASQLAEADDETLEETDGEDDDREVRCDGGTPNSDTHSALKREIAQQRAVDNIDTQIDAALADARLGVLHKPFADAPGAIDANPATWWDYFWAELSPVPTDAYRDSAAEQASGQVSLGDFDRLVTDGGTVWTETEQARLEVGNTRKPIAVKNARRVTTGDLAALAMCAHRFDPSDVEGWYTHEFDDVLRQWICSNVESVIARLSPHCETKDGDLPPLHPADDLWVGEVETGPTQTTLDAMEDTQ